MKNKKTLRFIGTLRVFLTLLAVFALSPGIQALWAAEEARLMERWLVTDPLSTRAVDHTLWAEILASYVVEAPNGRSLFDYGAVTTEDKKKLDDYLDQLARTDVDRFNREEQMAFWVNAFNALVIRFVLNEYPVRSIQDIGGGFFSSGPWDKRVFRVYSIKLSLNDIYHRILRPIWQDPRVHYVLGCAAAGCADLVAYPYTGPAIDRVLDVAAQNFVNRGPAITATRDGSLRLSSIYQWYEDDFGNSEEDIIAHLRGLANDELSARLDQETRVSSYGFDWALNDARQ